MAELGKVVPILPLVTKADSMTIREAAAYRREVYKKLQNPQLAGPRGTGSNTHTLHLRQTPAPFRDEHLHPSFALMYCALLHFGMHSMTHSYTYSHALRPQSTDKPPCNLSYEIGRLRLLGPSQLTSHVKE